MSLGDFIQSSASELDDLKDKIENSNGEDEVAHSNIVKVVNTMRILKEQYDALSLSGSSYLINY